MLFVCARPRPSPKAVLFCTHGRMTAISIASGLPQKPKQCRENVWSTYSLPQKPWCGQHSVKAEKESLPKRVDVRTTYGRRQIQDLVNQSGTICSMVETPAMLLRTITTISLLAPLLLGNIIQQWSSAQRSSTFNYGIYCAARVQVNIKMVLNCADSKIWRTYLLITKTELRFPPNGSGHLQRGDLPQRAVQLR